MYLEFENIYELQECIFPVKLFCRRMHNYATLCDKFIQHYATLCNPRR